jgi:hypothetical protein
MLPPTEPPPFDPWERAVLVLFAVLFVLLIAGIVARGHA